MASNREEKIFPAGNTMTIAIALKDFQKFKEVFWSDKLYNFHIKNKAIISNEVIFEARSMRVNEFIDILDSHNIYWRDIYEKY